MIAQQQQQQLQTIDGVAASAATTTTTTNGDRDEEKVLPPRFGQQQSGGGGDGAISSSGDAVEVLLQGSDGEKVALIVPRTLPTDELIGAKLAAKSSPRRGPDDDDEHRTRKVSLTPEEEFVLSRLLLFDDDKPADESGTNNSWKGRNYYYQVPKRLTPEILFSVPAGGGGDDNCRRRRGLEEEAAYFRKTRHDASKRRRRPQSRRPSIAPLWQAHAAGVAPRALVERGTRNREGQPLHVSKSASFLPAGGGGGVDVIAFESPKNVSDQQQQQQQQQVIANDGDVTATGLRKRRSSKGLLPPPVPRPPGGFANNAAATKNDNRGGSGGSPSKKSSSSGGGGGGGHHHRRSRSANFAAQLAASVGDLVFRRSSHLSGTGSSDAASDAPSDQEVRRDDPDDRSECSSWDETDIDHDFDPWEILNDEYAKDFGFDYSSESPLMMATPSEYGDNDSTGRRLEQHHHNPFLILGTSADDKSAQPHVLSPPLMDALMSHLPDRLKGENYWLKFSLIRDGASLDTMKRYVRAPKYTILAIETDRGDVFGCFTSQPWRTCPGFFGSAPAFVWKMRHSRRTRCSSLFDQAQLESEIDVYPFAGTAGSQYVQVCKHDMIAVGGDDDMSSALDNFSSELSVGSAFEMQGFAIALEDDLLRGTTSPSASFGSPSLLCGSDNNGTNGDKSQVFFVSGLEVWTFTPCRDVDSAEKMELSKYFVEQSTRSSITSTPGSRSPSLRREDLVQSEFYKRVGQDVESEERRDRWQYHNMMGGVAAAGGGRGMASPRFGYK